METFSALLAICAGNSPVPPHKGQWCGALMFSLICVWINGWINNREAGDLRRHRAHYDVIVMANNVRCRCMDAVVRTMEFRHQCYYCLYYHMSIGTITFINCTLYVSEIAKVWYTLTWRWPFDSDGISSWKGLRSALWLKTLFIMLYKRCCITLFHILWAKWNSSSSRMFDYVTLHTVGWNSVFGFDL